MEKGTDLSAAQRGPFSFLFQIVVVQMVEVLVMAGHMGEGIDLDEAVIASVPDELPETDVLPGGADAVQLGLGLSGVATCHLIDGGALVDILNDEALDLLGWSQMISTS